jgi:hypothetical protein
MVETIAWKGSAETPSLTYISDAIFGTQSEVIGMVSAGLRGYFLLPGVLQDAQIHRLRSSRCYTNSVSCDTHNHTCPGPQF